MAIVGAESGSEGGGGGIGGAACAKVPRNAGAFPAGGRAGSDGMAAEGTGGGGIPAAGPRSAGHARPPGAGDGSGIDTAIVVSESESSCEYLTIVGAESGSSSSGAESASVGAESGAAASTAFAAQGPVGRSLIRFSSLGGPCGGSCTCERSVGGRARSDPSGALSRAGGGASRTLTRSASATSSSEMISSSFTEITSSSSWGDGVGNEMGASGIGVRYTGARRDEAGARNDFGPRDEGGASMPPNARPRPGTPGTPGTPSESGDRVEGGGAIMELGLVIGPIASLAFHGRFSSPGGIGGGALLGMIFDAMSGSTGSGSVTGSLMG
jgi:hypothetical protein